VTTPPTTVPAVDGRCEECGFDYDALDPAGAPAVFRALPRRYRAPLTRFLPGEDPSQLIRRRPAPTVWSALEYACHVRDVLGVQRGRLERMLTEDHPTLERLGMWGWAERDGYNESDPSVVVDELTAAADSLAAAVEAVPAGGWSRTAVFGYPEPTERTARWLVAHSAHEGHHHLLDIGRALRSARGR
jgi:S-DNA-T family DNA segregation ATPase FtsK/SpoIIIE